MSYAWIFLVLAALVAALRVFAVIRRMRASASRDDIDERLVKSMREGGMDMFVPTEVDFFFSLPDAAACTAVRAQLEPEGCGVDVKELDGESGGGFSLHARRTLRVSVTEMQEHSRRFAQLAQAQRGSYDGWAAAGMQLPRRLATATPTFLRRPSTRSGA